MNVVRFFSVAAITVLTSLASFSALAETDIKIPAPINAVLNPDNTHLIDSASNGFAIYRTSKPQNSKSFRKFCETGVTEIMVLDGEGSIDAGLAKKYCPQLKVIYNVKQDAKVPLTESFLDQFDAWVAKAKRDGKKVAFRCNCGCHRTGRLAAYYRMTYNGYTAEQAISEMNELGRYMFLYPFLTPQVRSLYDFAQGKACSQSRAYCVKLKS